MLLFLADVPVPVPVNGSESDIEAMFRVHHYAVLVRSVYDYYVPILIVGGLLCNIVSVVVFGSNDEGGSECGDAAEDGPSPLPRSPASSSLNARDSYDTYLTSRAGADCVFLLCLLVVWLDTVNVPMYTTGGWCQVRRLGWPTVRSISNTSRG